MSHFQSLYFCFYSLLLFKFPTILQKQHFTWCYVSDTKWKSVEVSELVSKSSEYRQFMLSLTSQRINVDYILRHRPLMSQGCGFYPQNQCCHQNSVPIWTCQVNGGYPGLMKSMLLWSMDFLFGGGHCTLLAKWTSKLSFGPVFTSLPIAPGKLNTLSVN